MFLENYLEWVIGFFEIENCSQGIMSLRKQDKRLFNVFNSQVATQSVRHLLKVRLRQWILLTQEEQSFLEWGKQVYVLNIFSMQTHSCLIKQRLEVFFRKLIVRHAVNRNDRLIIAAAEFRYLG